MSDPKQLPFGCLITLALVLFVPGCSFGLGLAVPVAGHVVGLLVGVLVAVAVTQQAQEDA